MELYNEENASPTISNIFELKRQEGKMEEQREIARNLLKKIPYETIVTATKLTLEKVEALSKNLN